MRVEVKAIACELPSRLGVPLSRFFISEIRKEVMERGIVAKISDTTLWRWLSQDAIRPWSVRSWIFPRDPDFSAKAGRVLDLYQDIWEEKALGKRDFVVCADEKTGLQALARKHPVSPPGPGRAMRVEHEYQRGGPMAYLAALDVKRGSVFGRCEERSGIDPFERLVEQAMSRQPYLSARRVFWIMDNGSFHRGERCVERLKGKWKNLVPVHLPVHASWLNQVEIYFSVVKRKVLTPNDFSSLAELEERLLGFQERYSEIAEPFEWNFTRADLDRLMRKLDGDNRSVLKAA